MILVWIESLKGPEPQVWPSLQVGKDSGSNKWLTKPLQANTMFAGEEALPLYELTRRYPFITPLPKDDEEDAGST